MTAGILNRQLTREGACCLLRRRPWRGQREESKATNKVERVDGIHAVSLVAPVHQKPIDILSCDFFDVEVSIRQGWVWQERLITT